ncbi:MAG: S-adenosylmethionine synthetase, partial [Thermoproteota archaeon]
MARNIYVEEYVGVPIAEQKMEIVERKGIGHPDTICDSIMEALSIELSREYLKRFGRIYHYNVDKGMLVAGRSEKVFGGGRVTEPMLLIFGDRATRYIGGDEVPIDEIAVETAKRWLR